FLRAPTWLKVFLIGTALLPFLPLLHGPTRARVGRLLESARRALGARWTEARPHLERWMTDLREQSFEARRALAELKASLPDVQRLPLRVLAFRALVEAKRPLSLVEVAQAILTMGYKPKGKNF